MHLKARLIIAAAWLACRLPEAPLLALADFAGDLSYRLATARRRRAKRNLTRVVRWLADHDMGSPEVHAAARDGRVLNRLVRDAFRHSARYYVQLVRAPLQRLVHLRGRRQVDRRLVMSRPGG